jgi:para-aminobenzoate synthetase/4-amino-4-deoxychorismate lyase
VLLDGGPDGRSLLYRDPVEQVEARDAGEVRDCLDRLRASRLHAAGFLGYEAGHALEPKLAPLRRGAGADSPPLLWFGLFERCDIVAPETLLPDPASAWVGPARPLIAREAYEAAVDRAREHIFAGDIYQANISFPAEVRIEGSPEAAFAAMRSRARTGWSAMIFTGRHWLLSLSPELFFILEDGQVTTRPMKGTAAAGTPAEALRGDPKQRAENLMIVDLLRNDLSRVSRPGTVKVPCLFEVETYPTLLQLTSTIVGELADGRGAIDLIEAIFPCGSITGAPKIRAMELIAGIEGRARGVYTGAIGRLAPGGEAAFNVAIRTLVLRDGDDKALLGLGSGIVADSVAAEEWRECIAKGAFVESRRSFDLIETMRFDPREGVPTLERHLARMKASADALGFTFDRHHARNELQAATFRLRSPHKLRLLLARSGAIAIEARPLAPVAAEPIRVGLAPLPVAADDFRLRHKTSDRDFYDAPRFASGADEILFVDPEGFLTEGSFTTLFVERDGRLLTPPLGRGLLPGILRECLLGEGRALESDLVPGDLQGTFYVGNAVRGLIAARLVEDRT